MNGIKATASNQKPLMIVWAAARVAGTFLLALVLCVWIGLTLEEIESWLRGRYRVMRYPNILRQPHQNLSLLGVSVCFLAAMLGQLMSVIGALLITRWREPIAALAGGGILYVVAAVGSFTNGAILEDVAYAFGVVVGAAIAVRLIWRRVWSARTAEKAVQAGDSTHAPHIDT
jgi:hypothetical protein